MGSHSVTCHPAEVTFPCTNRVRLRVTSFVRRTTLTTTPCRRHNAKWFAHFPDVCAKQLNCVCLNDWSCVGGIGSKCEVDSWAACWECSSESFAWWCHGLYQAVRYIGYSVPSVTVSQCCFCNTNTQGVGETKVLRWLAKIESGNRLFETF